MFCHRTCKFFNTNNIRYELMAAYTNILPAIPGFAVEANVSFSDLIAKETTEVSNFTSDKTQLHSMQVKTISPAAPQQKV